MLGLSKPKTEYRVKMYWFENTGAKAGVLQYKPLGKPFKCAYDYAQGTSYISSGQGIVFKSLNLETEANYTFKKNDKIRYLGHDYIVQDISIANNSTSGSDYTNKPTSITKFITIVG